MLKSLFSLLKIVIICIPFIYACSGSEGTGGSENEVIYSKNDQINPKDKESLIDRNKKMILLEQVKIDSFIAKNNYKMEKTKTGIHYVIDKVGKGEQPKNLAEVELKYTIHLLNGDYCYSSDSSGVMQIKIGQSNEPTGLQEALQQIPCGSKATIIIPSYLAYGISGDGNKIGSQESLVYNIELLKVKN
jgi:FKBP-type peptidyl-prolyl cis-trans isomerase